MRFKFPKFLLKKLKCLSIFLISLLISCLFLSVGLILIDLLFYKIYLMSVAGAIVYYLLYFLCIYMSGVVGMLFFEKYGSY